MEPVTTMPVVEHVNICFPQGPLYNPWALMVGSLLILLLLLLLWHSVRASRSAQMCRLAHYIALTKCIGVIGFAAGFMWAAYRMMLAGFKIVQWGGESNQPMVWRALAFILQYLALGAGILLYAYIQAAIFQLVAARADATPSCAQPVARNPNPQSPLDEEAAGQ